MITSKFVRLLILSILAAILVAGFLFIQTPLFTKLAALANQNLIIEPIEEPSGYYSVDTSKVWPLGNTEKAQSNFDRAMAKEVLSGGFILVFRHAQRFKVIDVTKYDALELIQQVDGEKTYFKNAVCLSENEGVMQARAMGDYFKLLKIPVGAVISSPSCRSRQTALLAFSKIDRIETRLLHFYGEPYGPFDSDSVQKHYSEIKQILISAEPHAGTNTVISAHNNTVRKFIIDGLYDQKSINLNRLDFTLEEGGFHLLKVKDGKLLYVTKFNNFSGFSNKFLDRPTEYKLK
jgi:phosphohistidine phosphatase SixA